MLALQCKLGMGPRWASVGARQGGTKVLGSQHPTNRERLEQLGVHAIVRVWRWQAGKKKAALEVVLLHVLEGKVGETVYMSGGMHRQASVGVRAGG